MQKAYPIDQYRELVNQRNYLHEGKIDLEILEIELFYDILVPFSMEVCMEKYRNSLPNSFPIGVISSASPTQLYDLLRDLYVQECALNPTDAYLAHHGTPADLLSKIYSFCDYTSFLPSAGKILDWGCNHAPDSCLVRSAFGDRFELHSCDFREPGAFPIFSSASKSDYKKVTSVIKLPYENDFFDSIIASGALEHAASDYRSLEELYRVLKPEGRLIINYLPNHFSLHEKISEYFKKEGFHFRQYSISSVKHLLKGNGFFPIKSGYQSYFWDRRLSALGLKKRTLLTKLLCGAFPIHLIGGSIQVIAVKKVSM